MSKKVLRTRLCDLLDIEYPILLAGMGGAANAELAAAVSEAGGLGIIGAINLTPDELDAEIRKLKKLTSKPFGVDTMAPTNMVDAATIDELRNYIPEEAVTYASKLVKAYHHRDKIFETFALAEACSVNTVLTNPALCDVINDYWRRGGRSSRCGFFAVVCPTTGRHLKSSEGRCDGY